MHTFETIFSPPLSWVADQLERIPREPGRRVLVLVASERLAHAVRRHVGVEQQHPEHLAGVLFLRPADLARELLARSGTVRKPGWEDVRRLRIQQLFESGALAEQLRYFSAAQLRSGQGYVDAFARTITDLEASGLDAALSTAVARRLGGEDRWAADRLHDVAVTWSAADAGASTLSTTAQLLAAAIEVVEAQPQLLVPFGPVFAALSAAPSTVLLRFLHALPGCRVVLQDARPQRTGTQRWRALLGLQVAHEDALPSTDSPTAPLSPLPRGTAGGSNAGLQPPSFPLLGKEGERGATGDSKGSSDSELRLVQRYLFGLPEVLTDPQRPRSRGADGSVDVEEYLSIEEEIEAAGTWVTEQIAAGIPVEQIALIVPEIEPYAGLLMDRLARLAGTASNERVRVYVAGGLRLADSPSGTRLRGLLQAVARGLEAEATIRVLPWLRRRNQGNDESRERLSPSRAAEIVYGAGIVGGSPGDPTGLGEWTPRLGRRCDVLHQLVDHDDTEPGGGTGDGAQKHTDVRERHAAARWLRDVEPLLPAITALQELAETVLGGATLSATWRQLRSFCDRWLRLPPDPPNLLAILDRSLQPVLDDPIAHVASGLGALRFLTDVLYRERQPTARFGEPCIFVGTGVQAAGVPFVAVRILGLAEGALPHTPHDDPIVPDRLRAAIEDVARAQQSQPDVVVPRLADHVLDDIHDVFRVVSGTTTRLALSAPRQWVDRSEREVSGILLEVATALGRTPDHGADEGDVPTAARLRAAYLDAGRRARAQFAGEQPLTPRALLAVAAGAERGPRAVPASWTDGAALAVDRLQQINAMLEGEAFAAIDGMVTDVWAMLPPPGLVPERPISASALTRLLECPHRFLLERILYLTEPERRPSTDVIMPVDYGKLFHKAAERFFREAGAALCRRTGTVEHWVARAREIAAEEFQELLHGHPIRGRDGIDR